MRIVRRHGRDDLAVDYIGQSNDGKRVEFVRSLQPPFTKEEKLVMIVSTLFGCPVKCEMCDAGGDYSGKLTAEEMFFQIDKMVADVFPDGAISSDKFKIQFARMGEPSFNENVLKVMKGLSARYKAKCLIPSLSSVAPAAS